MSTLVIDAVDLFAFRIAVTGDENTLFEKQVESGPETLLEHIDALLREQGIERNELTQILVVRGPGSLTATRTSVTVANTLAWALNARVIGVDGPVDSLQELVGNQPNDALSPFVTPLYDRPPRITPKKHS